ncbi:helix-turn-helix transcriptional regulator [Candidatus Lokiarchaeum ossiferum]|uniref:helix-turn-helix transcriptional regulator n=1 Tax=Candidatus Lokiarchaeum ossiferum TaxID=2951803 RepID=UPI00352BF5E3
MKNRVKELRIEKNITQQELATAVNITRQAISYIEKNQKNPNIIIALKIAEYFKIPVDEIFELETADR